MKERTRQERKTLCVPGYRPAVAPLPVGRWNLIGGRVVEQDIQFCSLGVIQGQHAPHRGHWAVTGAVHWPLGAGCEQRGGDSLVWTVIESAARSGHRILCPVQCAVQTTKGVHYIRCTGESKGVHYIGVQVSQTYTPAVYIYFYMMMMTHIYIRYTFKMHTLILFFIIQTLNFRVLIKL